MRGTKESRRRTTLVALTAVLTFVFASVSLYAIASAPSGVLKIAKLGSKKAVSFNHAQHIAAGFYPSCNTCHHKTEGEPSGEAARCTTCHTEPARDEATPSAKKAFHGTCKKCHVERNEAGSTPNGPTSCGDCHKG